MDGTTGAVAQADTGGFIASDAVQFGQTALFTGNKNVGTNRAIAVNTIRAEEGMPDATTQPPTRAATAAARAMLLSGDGGRVHAARPATPAADLL